MFRPSVVVSISATDRDVRVGRRSGDTGGARGAVYPMLDLSHEPGSWFPEGITEVTCRLASTNKHVAFDVRFSFYVCVGMAADSAPAPRLEVLSGEFPWVEELPGNIAARSLRRAECRDALRRLARRGAVARNTVFPEATRRFVATAAAKITGIRSDAALEQSEAYLEGQFRVAAAGRRYASPERPAASWTTYVFRNVTRDMRRAEERLDGRPSDVQQAERLIRYYGAATPAEAAARHGLLSYVTQLRAEQPDVPYADLEKAAAAAGPNESTIPTAVWEEAFRGRLVVGSLDKPVGDTENCLGDLIPGEAAADTSDLQPIEALQVMLTGSGISVTEVLPWLVREGAVPAGRSWWSDEIEDADAAGVPDSHALKLSAAYRAAERFFHPFTLDGESWRRLETRAVIQQRAFEAFHDVDLSDPDAVAAVWQAALDERFASDTPPAADCPLTKILDGSGVTETELGAWVRAITGGVDPAKFDLEEETLEGGDLAEVAYRIVRHMIRMGETWSDKTTKLRVISAVLDAAEARKAARVDAASAEAAS